MSILTKLFKRKNEETQISTYPDADLMGPEICYEEIPGTLDLGWYYSKDKGELQMAKIAEEDRATHFYVIGATGTGKTKFLEFLIAQDIGMGRGFGVIDPHGDLIEDIKGLMAFYYDYHNLTETLADRVVLIDPTNHDFTVTFNPLEKIPGISSAEQSGQLISAFKKIWSSAWGVRMEDLLRNSLLALSEAELTLVELPHFLTNRAFRRGVLEKVTNPIVHEYFKRFDRLTDRGQVTWIEPVMNKINALFSDERIRQMFSSQKSSFDLREIMDSGKILLIKLDKGKLHDLSDLLGSLLVARIQMAAFSRSDTPQDQRTPFYLYIDEFQNFATDTFSVVLSEARKYGLSLIMAHQTLSQIPAELRSLILGNTGIQVYFRLNRHDADALAKEGFEYSGYEVKTVNNLHPVFWSYREEWEHNIGELQNLSPRKCYVKHKIEGGMISLTTVDIEPARVLLGMEEHEYQNFLQDLPFGRKYLVSRKELAASEKGRIEHIHKEYGIAPVREKRPLREPLQTTALPERDTVRETARKEAIISIENKQAEKLPMSGQEGQSQHRFLQDLIKQAAEGAGYRAEIEKQTSDGLGRVDVHIERNGSMIACEVCVGSTGEKEAANIEKRIKAGYETIILCSPEKGILERAKALVSEKLKDPEKKRVLFFEPPELFSYLERLGLKAGAGAGIETDTDTKEKSLTLKSEEQLHEKPKLKLVIRDKQVFTGARRTIEDREVFLNGKSYRLTNKPFLFLYALARSRKLGQRCVQYDTLFNLTSGLTEKSVSKHIKTIKEHIPPLKTYIETLPKLGYSLTLSPSEIEINGVLEGIEGLLK
ncbi:MAG TPA: TraM recognition domain-containing protein [Candidatus Avalokitesvara rifleensis]|uniref:TraM recognition domain-containing protein n=1 Tax=Candidatus Avalokitesvara rifleensis TaxID=3367620 RepID=UPI00271252DB|nr:type IV secretion system DNA-binding domain-containing protein [Candidatus Brocadiales bacterium]